MDNETLKAIAETLIGIQTELKNLNQQVSRMAAKPASQPETSTGGGSYGRTEFRPKRGIASRSGPSKFGRGGFNKESGDSKPSRGGGFNREFNDSKPGRSGFAESRGGKPTRGSFDKPARRP